MEEENDPKAPVPAPEDAAASAVDAPAAPAAPDEPAAGPVPAPAAAPKSAPEPPAAPVAPVTAPVAAPVETPAAPAAPVAAPREPVAPSEPAAPAQPAMPPVGSSAAGPAAAPVQPGGPAQPVQPGGPVPAGAYPPPPMPGYGAPKSGKAMGALICGILAIVFSFIPLAGLILGIVAIVLAGKAVREAGRDGKATGGKVCGIIGIVFSIVWAIGSVLITMGLIGLAGSYDAEPSPDFESAAVSDPATSTLDPADLDAEQRALYEAADVIFAAMVSQDPQFMQELAVELDDELRDSLGVSYSEIGLDPATMAEWATTDLAYDIDSVFIDTDDAAKATVYIQTTERDSFDLHMALSDKLSDYTSSSEGKNASPEAAMAKVGELMTQAMDESTDTTTYFAAIDFVKQGDTWVADEDSLEEEMGYMFGTF